MKRRPVLLASLAIAVTVAAYGIPRKKITDLSDRLITVLNPAVAKTASSYWGNAVAASIAGPLAHQGLEPYATWRNLPGDAPIKIFNNARAIQIVQVGGKTQSTWFATDFRLGRGVSIGSWK